MVWEKRSFGGGVQAYVSLGMVGVWGCTGAEVVKVWGFWRSSGYGAMCDGTLQLVVKILWSLPAQMPLSSLITHWVHEKFLM